MSLREKPAPLCRVEQGGADFTMDQMHYQGLEQLQTQKMASLLAGALLGSFYFNKMCFSNELFNILLQRELIFLRGNLHSIFSLPLLEPFFMIKENLYSQHNKCLDFLHQEILQFSVDPH